MQHIDPELFTWLFIGAVGLVAGVWGLTRAASRRRGEAELSRLGKTSAAAPRRRERIAARRPDVPKAVKKETVEPKAPQHGPGRPAAFLLKSADGRTIVLQRAPEAECREGLERLYACAGDAAALEDEQNKLDAAAQQLALRGGALEWSVDSDLAHNAFVLCCAKTQEAPATASAAALGTGGLLIGNSSALDGAEPLFAAVEEGFRIAAAPEGVLLRSLNDCLESAEKHLSRLEKLSPQRTEDWLQTADKIKALGEEAQRLTINGNWADWDTALTLEVIDALTQSVDERILKIDAALEAAAESDALTALESADTALKHAYGLLLERISAVLLLEAFAASNVLYSTDYCRGMHSASRIALRAQAFPSTQKITNAVHALILQTAETSGRTMTPQALDLLGTVKQDAKMLEALEGASSTELQNGVKALQRVMDRRLLAEHPIARLMICMDGDGAAHFARPL